MVQSEMAALCSDVVDSTLKHHSRDELLNFKWSNILDELQQHAPVFLEILLAATTTRCPRPNRDALIRMCTAMICKLHRPQLSAAQKTLSLILYAGHASKEARTPHHSCLISLHNYTHIQVFTRLHKLGLVTSHKSTIRLLDELGSGHDSLVHQWREKLLGTVQVHV